MNKNPAVQLAVAALAFGLAAGRASAQAHYTVEGESLHAVVLDPADTVRLTFSFDPGGELVNPTLSGGFFFWYDPLEVEILQILVYDGGDLPGPWDPTMTTAYPGDDGNGNYFCCLIVGQLSCVPVSAPIPLADVIFYRTGSGNADVTIIPVPDFDTWVTDPDSICWDPEVDPGVIQFSSNPAPSPTPEPGGGGGGGGGGCRAGSGAGPLAPLMTALALLACARLLRGVPAAP